jgi:2'-5' RNA ligase
MFKDPPVRDRINSYALVTYIPEPLAGFLDRLRQELVPNCFLRAHVTILPPRALSFSPGSAWELIQGVAPRFTPFEIRASSVQIFPVTDVIYIQVAAGNGELKQMHDALNIGGLASREEFLYQPHITLAQDLKPDEVDELVQVARARWEEFHFPKSFRAEQVYFVQNTRCNEWVDLGKCELGRREAELVRELTDLLVS